MDNIFLTLINMSITASWTALAVILLRLLLKKAPKAIICVLWALVGVRLVLPITYESVLSLVPSADTVPLDIVYAREPQIHTGISYLNSAVNPIITESFAPSTELTSINPIQVWLFLAEQIWAIGIVAMLVYTAYSYIRLRIRVREAVKDGGVWICDRIDTPFILGVIRPKIYVPSSMSESDLEYVIAHEKAHIRRRDYIWKPLGFALLTVYWFNPVMWLAYILLCRDIESACDEKVLREKGTEIKKAYSDALINASVPRKLISACPLAFGETSVKSRVKSVLNYKKPAFWIIIVALAACAVTAVCFLTNPKEDKKVTFNGAPLTFDKEDVYVFYPKELVYDAPMFSYVMTADAAPDYRLHGNLTLEEKENDIITAVGKVSEIKLEKDVFDNCFEISGKKTAAELRKNNRRAWRLFSDKTEKMYILLEQKDGTYYMCVGWFDHEGEDILWVYRVNKERQSYISQISEVGGYNIYKYHNSPDPTEPSILLYDEPKTFTFSWSGFSSYFAVGKYELDGETLTLKTDDGLNTYVFDVVGDTYVFDASRSSSVPSYKYSADAPSAECPVPDGAVFEFDTYMDRFSMIYDTAMFDIDSDGEDETVIMSMGPTSGLFTLTFTVIKENSDHFESVVYGGNWSDFYFHEDENGKVTFCTVDAYTDEKTYHELSFKDGTVFLTDSSGVQFENTKYVLNPTNEGVEEFLNLIDWQDEEENGKWYNVTPDAIKEEIGIQIFKNDRWYSSVALIDGKTYQLGEYFGGTGFMSGVPCDFDNDGVKDILFTSSWGSGIHRTEVNVFNMATKETTFLKDYWHKDVMVALQDGEYKLFLMEPDLEVHSFAETYSSLTPIGSVKCNENGPYVAMEGIIAEEVEK